MAKIFSPTTRSSNSIIDLVKQTSGPIIEIGPGSGALTHPMAHLGRAITAVEVDAKLAAKITQETSSAAVEVVHDDFLNFRLPPLPASCGKLPFTSPLPFSKVAACASMD